MEHRAEDGLPPELDEVVALLRDERPTLGAIELDRTSQLVRARADRASAPRRLPWRERVMKSSIALTAVLVLGLLFAIPGATLAVTGLSDGDSAGTAQYDPTPPPGGCTEGAGCIGGKQTDPGSDPVQGTRQISGDDKQSLPFTGFAAVPLLLLGLVMMGTGAMGRRRLRRDRR